MRLTIVMLWLCALAMPASAGAAEVAPSAQEIRPLLIGAKVPEVMVQTIEGEAVSLPEALAGEPTVLVFFRGGW